MTPPAISFLPFWGKAWGGVHPLWMHSLDVAAVGQVLASLRPRLFERTADRLGWTAGELRGIWTFLLALHDIGKFARQFQAKAPHAWPVDVLGPYEEAHIPGADPGHGAAGVMLLFAGRSLLRPLLDAWLPGWDEGEHETRPILLAPILGHHGRPVGEPGKPFQDLFSPQAEAAALAFGEAMHALLRPPALPEPSAAALRRATWPLAGLTVIADWVGSNTAWFPYRANEPRILLDRPGAALCPQGAGRGGPFPFFALERDGLSRADRDQCAAEPGAGLGGGSGPASGAASRPDRGHDRRGQDG
jgi:CRISPR-associated endonuclease/helicase Cas3